MALKKPTLTEIANSSKQADYLSSYTNGLVRNPDTVLQSIGGDIALYTEISRDDQVKSTFQQRITALNAKEVEVTPASDSAKDQEIAKFVETNLKRIKFDTVTERMMWGLFYGYSVAEIIWGMDAGKVIIDDIKVRDRSRFGFDIDGGLRLLTIKDPKGKKMPDRKFWTFSSGGDHSDNPYGVGLAHYLYWPTFFKRNGVKFWMVYLEKFGMPTVKATASSKFIDDPAEKAKLLDALQAIQVDGAVIIPDGVEIDLIEAVRGGTSDYSELQSRMDASISKIVLSQTMTTDNGSSYSQANVHKEVRDEVVESDAFLLDDSFNKSVVKWLVEFNYGDSVELPRVRRVTEPDEDANVRAERDVKIKELGYEPTQEYIDRNYGEGWVKSEAQAMPAFAEFADPSSLEIKKQLHRSDMDTLVKNAELLASNPDPILGKRISQLMALAEETQDYATFNERLTELVNELPNDQTVETIRNVNFFSKILGSFRGQR